MNKSLSNCNRTTMGFKAIQFLFQPKLHTVYHFQHCSTCRWQCSMCRAVPTHSSVPEAAGRARCAKAALQERLWRLWLQAGQSEMGVLYCSSGSSPATGESFSALIPCKAPWNQGCDHLPWVAWSKSHISHKCSLRFMLMTSGCLS